MNKWLLKAIDYMQQSKEISITLVIPNTNARRMQERF